MHGQRAVEGAGGGGGTGGVEGASEHKMYGVGPFGPVKRPSGLGQFGDTGHQPLLALRRGLTNSGLGVVV